MLTGYERGLIHTNPRKPATTDWKKYLVAAMLVIGRSLDYDEMTELLGRPFINSGNVDLDELQRWCVAIRLTFDCDLHEALQANAQTTFKI